MIYFMLILFGAFIGLVVYGLLYVADMAVEKDPSIPGRVLDQIEEKIKKKTDGAV